MANDLYRGYEIVQKLNGGFTWTDERGFEHFYEGVSGEHYATPEQAMDDIDRYKRNMASGTS